MTRTAGTAGTTGGITGAQVQVSNFSIQNFVVGSTQIKASNANTTGQIDVDSVYAADVSYD